MGDSSINGEKKRPPSETTSLLSSSPSTSSSLSAEEQKRAPVTLERGTLIYHHQKYYTRLFDEPEKAFVVPQHVIPSGLFFPWDQFSDETEEIERTALFDDESPEGKEGKEEKAEKGKHGSATIIFGMWNTMMGSGLLAVPWGFQQSGLLLGLGVCLLVSSICCYTCWLVYVHSEGFPDFADATRHYLGKQAGIICWFASICVLVGAVFAYDSLMSASLYSILKSFRVLALGREEVFENLAYEPLWAQKEAIPFYLFVVLFPLCCLRDVTPVVKFNSLGVFCVVYMVLFIIFSCIFVTGFHHPGVPTPTPHPMNPFDIMDDDSLTEENNFASSSFSTLIDFVSTIVQEDLNTNAISDRSPYEDFGDYDSTGVLPTPTPTHTAPPPPPAPPIQFASPHFYYLGGMAIMMFFIHNSVASLVRTAKNKDKIKRDILIAFFFVLISYTSVGAIGYSAYRYLPCFPQNFLDESVFPVTYIPAVIARFALLGQLTTVLALLAYIIRVQLFGYLLGSRYPGLGYILFLNFCILATATAISCLFPNAVATIIRFSGSICGTAYCFCFPVLVNWKVKAEKGTATLWDKGSAVVICGFSLVLLGSQFIPNPILC